MDGFTGCRKLECFLLLLCCLGGWLICACSNWMDGNVRWSKYRGVGVGQVVGFIDDSLVIVSDWREWSQELGSFVWDGGEIGGIGHQGLRVYNYRIQEDGPRWVDTLDNADIEDFNYVRGQLSDSVVWGGDPKTTVSFWKIGEKPHKMKIKKVLDGCNVYFRVEKLRNWLDGMIYAGENLMVSGDTCQYAVLDTVTRTLTYKRLDKDLEWIKKCDDVRAWDNEVYCLILKDVPINLYLVKNGDPLDTLLQNNPYNWASYTKVGFSGNLLNLGNNVCKILDDKIFCLGISIRSALEYRIGNDFTVIYKELLF